MKKRQLKAVKRKAGTPKRVIIADMLRAHFGRRGIAELTVSERKFPFRVRADLQKAIDGLFGEEGAAHIGFCGVRREYSYEGIDFPALLIADRNNPALPVPPQYEEVHVGDDAPVRCLKNGLWLLDRGGDRYAVLLSPAGRHGQT